MRRDETASVASDLWKASSPCRKTSTRWVARRSTNCSASTPSEAASRHPYPVVGGILLATNAAGGSSSAGGRRQHSYVQRCQHLGGCNQARSWPTGLPCRPSVVAAGSNGQLLRRTVGPWAAHG